jgi:hypothetical protein
LGAGLHVIAAPVAVAGFSVVPWWRLVGSGEKFMKLKIGILAASMLLASPAAFAQTLQGTYLFTYVETCQATFSWGTDPSTGDINTINSVDNGKISSTTGTAVFNPDTKKVQFTGFQESGDLLIIQEHGGTPVTDTAFNEKFTYATTAKNFVINGGKYHAAYSPSTGTVTSFVFGGLDSENQNCAVSGTGTLAAGAQ